MKIEGGFAGHGYRSGVNVNEATLVRACNDCGHSWPSDADDLTRVQKPCKVARLERAPAPRTHGSKRSSALRN